MFHLDPIDILLRIPAILIGLSFHEFAHAYAADRLGDKTPRLQGRLTLSPIAHIDPIGLILIIIAQFGWAKPVQINPRNFNNPRRDDLIVSFAGPLANFFTAILMAVLIKVLIIVNIFSLFHSPVDQYFMDILHYIVWYNILLGIFNLLPIPPLDGSHILEDLTNIERYDFYFKLKQYSIFLMIIIIATPVAWYIIRTPLTYSYIYLCNFLHISPWLLY